MGQQRNKVIETAVDLEKLEKADKEAQKKGAVSNREKPKESKPKKRSRNYTSSLYLIDKTKQYSPKEAISILKKTATTKFESTFEAHVNLNFSKDKTDQQIRTSLSLPHPISSRKNVRSRMVVFTSKNTDEIKKLGAVIGNQATLKEIEKGKIDFVDSTGEKVSRLEEVDKIISDPTWMPKLALVAKILGPKGLMPSPKSGTVTDDPISTLKEFAKGKTEIRTENYPIIHTKIGKSRFEEQKLEENFEALIKTIRENKPENFKRDLFRSIYLSSTMGPSVRIDLSSI